MTIKQKQRILARLAIAQVLRTADFSGFAWHLDHTDYEKLIEEVYAIADSMNGKHPSFQDAKDIIHYVETHVK